MSKCLFKADTHKHTHTGLAVTVCCTYPAVNSLDCVFPHELHCQITLNSHTQDQTAAQPRTCHHGPLQIWLLKTKVWYNAGQPVQSGICGLGYGTVWMIHSQQSVPQSTRAFSDCCVVLYGNVTVHHRTAQLAHNPVCEIRHSSQLLTCCCTNYFGFLLLSALSRKT